MAEASETSTYPGTLDTWVDVTDLDDLVEQSDINKIKNAIEAIQTELGLNPAGSLADLVTRLAVSIADNGAIKQGTSFPGSPVEGQMFWRTDTKTFFVYDLTNTAWVSANQLSNCIYEWHGSDAGTVRYHGGSLTPAEADGLNEYHFCMIENATAYETLLRGKFVKINGINTITGYIRAWTNGNSNGDVRVTVGGQTGTVEITSATTTPTAFTTSAIDVSGLSDGTAYDITIEMKKDSGGTSHRGYVSDVQLIAS